MTEPKFHFIVHTNGTSANELISQSMRVRAAARDLLEQIQSAYPNMRDYYPAANGNERFKTDRAEAQRMWSMAQEIEEWAMARGVTVLKQKEGDTEA